MRSPKDSILHSTAEYTAHFFFCINYVWEWIGHLFGRWKAHQFFRVVNRTATSGGHAVTEITYKMNVFKDSSGVGMPRSVYIVVYPCFRTSAIYQQLRWRTYPVTVGACIRHAAYSGGYRSPLNLTSRFFLVQRFPNFYTLRPSQDFALIYPLPPGKNT
jgi:hypothetical protein